MLPFYSATEISLFYFIPENARHAQKGARPTVCFLTYTTLIVLVNPEEFRLHVVWFQLDKWLSWRAEHFPEA
jgi:hypothetical protein